MREAFMNQKWWRAACGLAVLVQLVVLYAPRAPSTHGVPYVDKLIHASVFAAVAFTAVLAGFPWRRVLALLATHAILSEVLQATVLPHRDGEPLDAVADAIGATLGTLGALGLLGLLGPPDHRRTRGRGAAWQRH